MTSSFNYKRKSFYDHPYDYHHKHQQQHVYKSSVSNKRQYTSSSNNRFYPIDKSLNLWIFIKPEPESSINQKRFYKFASYNIDDEEDVIMEEWEHTNQVADSSSLVSFENAYSRPIKIKLVLYEYELKLLHEENNDDEEQVVRTYKKHPIVHSIEIDLSSPKIEYDKKQSFLHYYTGLDGRRHSSKIYGDYKIYQSARDYCDKNDDSSNLDLDDGEIPQVARNILEIRVFNK